MFGNKKKVNFKEVNDFLYKKIEELFIPIREVLLTKDAVNYKLSDKAATEILYELLFFFVYLLNTVSQYKDDEYLADFFERFSSFFKPPLKLEASEYSKRFTNIDEVMSFVATHAQNSGGLGSGILGNILYNLPDSTLKEIIITRDVDLEKMLGLAFEEEKNNDIFIYLPMLTGMIFGEMHIKFTKDIESYFSKHKIE